MLAVMTPFLIVRHPFNRLVSAYEDKILNPRPVMKFHEKVQAEIKKRRRKGEVHKIVFPEHLLQSEQYQRWLRRKVHAKLIIQTINYSFLQSGFNERSAIPTVL